MTDSTQTISIDLPVAIFERYSVLSAVMGADPQQIIETVLLSYFEEKMATIKRVADTFAVE